MKRSRKGKVGEPRIDTGESGRRLGELLTEISDFVVEPHIK
jgi:hypothetical protein